MNIRPPLREVPDGQNWTQGWTAFFTQLFEAVGWLKSWSYRFTLDFPSVPSGSQSSALTVMIPGVRQGDSVIVTPMSDTAGIDFKGRVTSDDTVSIYAMNFTAGAINPASMQFRIVVIQN